MAQVYQWLEIIQGLDLHAQLLFHLDVGNFAEILYNPFELRKILIILHILLKVQVKWMLFSKMR